MPGRANAWRSASSTSCRPTPRPRASGTTHMPHSTILCACFKCGSGRPPPPPRGGSPPAPAAPRVRHHVHAPRHHLVRVLQVRLALHADDADEGPALERAEDEAVAVRGDVLCEG